MPLNIPTDNQRVVLDGVEMLEARSGIFSKGFGASPQERKVSRDKNELCGGTHSQQEGGAASLEKLLEDKRAGWGVRSVRSASRLQASSRAGPTDRPRARTADPTQPRALGPSCRTQGPPTSALLAEGGYMKK